MLSCRLIVVLALLLVAPQWLKADEPALADQYGFLPLEVFKLGDRTSNLLPGDFNHDGRTDLVVINNQHHRLDVLLQRSEPSATTPPVGRKDVNRIDDAWRYELLKLPMDGDVVTVAVGDFNGDGRTDLASFVLPDQLIISFQPETGGWLKKQTLRIADVATGSWCVTAGDLNHDGRDDLVVLGKNEINLLHQQKTGSFGPITRLLNTSEKLGLAQVADLNGDDRADLCYLAGEGNTRGLGVRLQDAQGELGPESLFDLEKPRAVSIRNIDGRPGHEILTIDSRTNRLKVLRVVTRKFGPNEVRDRLVRYGFGRSGAGRERDVAVADFDGNGLVDVAVSDTDSARVLLFRQEPGRGLDLGTAYPSVSGAGVLRASSRQKPAELIIHSATEKSIGLARWKDERLSFPEALPIDHEPLGLELVELDPAQGPVLVFLTRSKDGRDTAYTLRGMHRHEPDGTWDDHPSFGGGQGLTVNIKAAPDRVVAADIMGDPRPELLLMQGSKPPVVLRLNETNKFQEVPIGGTISTGTLASKSAFPCRLNDRPGLLMTQDNFARHLEVSPQNRWQIGEQINASESAAKIVGAALINLDDSPEPEAVLVDAGVKKLRLMKREESVYAPWKEIDLGDLSFQQTKIADLNGDQRPDLLLFAADQLAVLYAGGSTPALEEVAAFESTLEKTFISDVVSGDLNGDGQSDLALVDTRSHYLELVQFTRAKTLRHALYFKLFEEKSFQKDDDLPSNEPREAVIADVTGDGLADLILLAHDRLLVYPQDRGPVPAKAASTRN